MRKFIIYIRYLLSTKKDIPDSLIIKTELAAIILFALGLILELRM